MPATGISKPRSRIRDFSTLGWVLGALLLLAAVTLLMGASETRAFPSATSYRPSGLAAFAELLRRDGYDVSLDFASKPKLGPQDLAVAVFIPTETTYGPGLTDTGESLQDILQAHMKKGGTVVAASVPEAFDEATKQASTSAAFASPTGQGVTLTIAPTEDNDGLDNDQPLTGGGAPRLARRTRGLPLRGAPVRAGSFGC